MHCLPPKAGAGSVQLLVRLLTVRGHGGHGLQADQSVHSPSMGLGTKRSNKKQRHFSSSTVDTLGAFLRDDSDQDERSEVAYPDPNHYSVHLGYGTQGTFSSTQCFQRSENCILCEITFFS